MPGYTESFDEYVAKRARRDTEFREMLLDDVKTTFEQGDFLAAKVNARYYIKATIGFEELARVTGEPYDSLVETFEYKGRPGGEYLRAVFAHLPGYEDAKPALPTQTIDERQFA